MRHWFRTIWNTRGLARWILLAGLVIVVAFVVLAVLAPWIAPYDFNQTRVDGDKLPKLAHPSGEHWLGTNDQFFDIWSRIIWGARTALEVIVLSVAVLDPDRRAARSRVGLHRRLGRPGPRVRHGLALRAALAAAGHRVLVPAARRARRRHRRGGALPDLHLHPAVLPRRPEHDRLGQAVGVRRGGPRHRCSAAHDHAQVPVRQRRPVGTGHRHPQRRRRAEHPGRPRASSASASSPPRPRSGATTSAVPSTTPRPAPGGRRCSPAWRSSC